MHGQNAPRCHFTARSFGSGAAQDQPFAPLRGLMKDSGWRFARFSALFSLSESFGAFFPARDCGVFPDILTRFPSSAGGLLTIDHSLPAGEVKSAG